MTSGGEEFRPAIDRVYTTRPDPSFTEVLEQSPAPSDDELADLIEADARRRFDRGLSVDLTRYVGAVPGLRASKIALDAAIEFAMRAMVRTGSSESHAAEALAARHPDLGDAIRLAAVLSQGVCSTNSLRTALSERGGVEIQIPCDSGLPLPNGRARFEIRQRLGTGAEGDVFLAVDRLLTEPDKPAWVAIKLLRTAGLDERSRALLTEEGLKRVRRIDHPNVVRVLDRDAEPAFGEYVVYEYVDGGDLATLIARDSAPLPPRKAAVLLAKICHGVHAAHLAGVVHCDLKPSNILLTREGEPKVADFGASARLRQETGATARHSPLGNLAFIAPEQFRAEEGAFAAPADVYALGGLLFHALTRRLPNGDTPEKVSARHARRDAPPPPASPRSVDPRIDRDLDAICTRALAPEPRDRHPSADALAADLEAWLARQPIHWARPGPLRRTGLFMKRQPGAAVAVLAGIVALAGAAGVTVYIWMTGRERLLQQQLTSARQLAEKEKQKNDFVFQAVDAVQNVLSARERWTLAVHWFPPLTIMESIAGPLLFDPKALGGHRAQWTNRIAIAESLVKQAEQAGATQSLECLLWLDAIAFWNLRGGDGERADAALRKGDVGWTKVLPPDDPWHDVRRSLRACADLQLADAAVQSGGQPPDSAGLTDLRDRLEASWARVSTRPNADAIRLLTAWHLQRLYGPRLLNDPAKREQFDKLLDEISGAGEPKTTSAAN